MTEVFEDAAARPGTHALVIGVGGYPHLIGGERSDAPASFGLKQLSSPPVSARAFADWLLTRFHNPGAPLASLRLLISEDSRPASHTSPRDGAARTVEMPTKGAMKGAVRAWKAGADGHEDNITLFYFCGHGLSNRAETALLARDFGDPRATTMENAIDFGALVAGMEACAARKQCYLIDACRNEPRELLELDDMGDRQVLDAVPAVTRSRPRNYPIYYATARDQLAHAPANQVSRYTRALVAALEGAGSHDPDGTSWVVTTYRLGEGVDAFLRLGNRRRGVPPQGSTTTGGLAAFDLHVLEGLPVVPVAVSCKPPEASGVGRLVVTPPQAAPLTPMDPDAEGWHLELEALPGEYLFEVRLDSAGYRVGSRRLTVLPSHRDVFIEVK